MNFSHFGTLYTLPVLSIMGLMIAILLLSYLVLFVFQWKRPDRSWKNLLDRLNTWWLLIGGLALSFAFPLKIAAAFWMILSGFAFYEFFSVAKVRRADRRVVLWLAAAIPFQYLWIILGWQTLFQIWIPVILFLLYPIRMVFAGEVKGFLSALGILYWGSMMTIYSLSHLAAILMLGQHYQLNAGPAGPFLYLLFLTQFNDAAQYIWGKSLGKSKIVPKVSPNKTWVGFIGGVVTTIVFSYFLAPFLTPFSPLASLIIGFLMGVAGFFGDVVMSAIKRDLGIKDFSVMLPGHGGWLDRVDSLTYTAPLFYYLLSFSEKI